MNQLYVIPFWKNIILHYVMYFCIFWPLGGTTAVNKLCKVFQKKVYYNPYYAFLFLWSLVWTLEVKNNKGLTPYPGLHPKYIFEQAFYRLILLIQKTKKIDILLVPFIHLNFTPSWGKKGSHEGQFKYFIDIFWVPL